METDNPSCNQTADIRLFTGGALTTEECDLFRIPVHLVCLSGCPISDPGPLLFHSLEASFRIVGDGMFVEAGQANPFGYEPNTAGANTQAASYFIFPNSDPQAFQWTVLCSETGLGFADANSLQFGTQNSNVPLFYLEVLADPGAEVSVDVELVNVAGLGNPTPQNGCSGSCCEMLDNVGGQTKDIPLDCSLGVDAILKELALNPGEEITYELQLVNNGPAIDFSSLDFRLRFDDMHMTIPEVPGLTVLIDGPEQTHIVLDENGPANGETSMYYYRFVDGALASGTNPIVQIVFQNPEGFENLLGEGNLTLEFVRIETSGQAQTCCQFDGFPLAETVVFPGVLPCEGSPVEYAIRIGELVNPPNGDCQTGFSVEFQNSFSFDADRLYIELAIETDGVMELSEIKPQLPNSPLGICLASCPGGCLSTCSTDHIILEYNGSGTPLNIKPNEFFEVIFDGNNGGIMGIEVIAAEIGQYMQAPCIPAINWDQGLQFPISKCDYCDEVTARVRPYAGNHPLEDDCEEGFSLFMDFGQTSVDRISIEFTIETMGFGIVNVNEAASTAFCSTNGTNTCDPGPDPDHCLEIDGTNVKLDMCFPNAQTFGDGIKIMDLVMNGDGTVSGVTITKLEVTPCDFSNCPGVPCDVRYLGDSNVFPLIPTVNPANCEDEKTIAGNILWAGDLFNPPTSGIVRGVGDVEVCMSGDGIFPSPPPPFNQDWVLNCTNPIASDVTDSGTGCNGSYGQTFVSDDNFIFVTPIKDCQDMEGVTTFDLVRITRHVLGSQPFTSPYQFIAGDANHSGGVSTFDITQLRRLILFIDPSLQSNTSWRFVEEDHVFPPNPLNPSFPEHHVATLSEYPLMDLDFVGIKIGDVNFSANPCKDCMGNFAPTGGGGSSALLVPTGSPSLSAGETGTLELAFRSPGELVAWQAGLRFDPDVIEFVGTLPADLPGFAEAKNYGLTEAAAGKIRVLWYSETGEAEWFRQDEGIIKLRFRALKDVGDLGSAVALDGSVLPCLAYDGQDREMHLGLANARTAGTATRFGTNVANDLAVKVSPNPSRHGVTFTVTVGTEAAATIAIFDTLGRQVTNWDGILPAGRTDVPFAEAPGWGSGVFTYLVKTPGQSMAGKLVRH